MGIKTEGSDVTTLVDGKIHKTLFVITDVETKFGDKLPFYIRKTYCGVTVDHIYLTSLTPTCEECNKMTIRDVVKRLRKEIKNARR